MSDEPRVIRWEDPPESRGRRSGTRVQTVKADPWVPVADELRASPNRWALVFEGENGRASGLALNVRLARSAAWLPAGAFDAQCRKAADGVTRVYAVFGPTCQDINTESASAEAT